MLLPNPSNKQLDKIEKFVKHHPQGNFFQSSEAYKFFNSLKNYDPMYILIEKNGEIQGLLLSVIIREQNHLKSFFSRRCIVWGGPLAYDHNINNVLVRELTEYVKHKAIYTEFRNLFDMNPLKNVFYNFGYEYQEWLNFIVTIESVELNMKKLNENRRRQIKKSIKSGTKIIEASNISQIKEFYNILKKLYAIKVKKPLPPFDFFENFFHNKKLGKYLLVEYNNTIIGGIMCPIFNDKIYEWYICGLDSEYKNQSPSVMATWAAIEYGAKNGLRYFDFMGAGKLGEDYGVRQFKSKFGGMEVRYGRYIRINNPFLYQLGKMGLKVINVLK